MILYLLGKSGSGKDTILKELLKDEELSLRPFTLYTTRPIRPGEKNGREYNFITEEEAKELERSKRLIEMRVYNTVYGPWKYMSYDNLSITDGDEYREKILPECNYITIGTLESYIKYADYYGNENIIPVYISADRDIRRERACLRLIKRQDTSAEIDGKQVHEYGADISGDGTFKPLSKTELDEIDRRLKADDADFSDDNLKKCGIDMSFDNSGKLEDCVNKIKEHITDILRAKETKL